MTSTAPQTRTVTGDHPVEDPSHDLLGYAPFAKHLAESIIAMAPPEGFVVGIYGAWGSGKTTLLRFIEHYLDQVPKKQRPIIVHFNPWWFSGHEDFTRHFFSQLRSTLSQWKSVGDSVLGRLGDLADTLSDFALPGAGALHSAVEDALPNGRAVPELKEQIGKALRKSKHRIVIIIDDLDRLSADEIRQVFRLIKIVADFPNVVYVVAFDRVIAVHALEETQGVDGNDYLEKIIQVALELPQPDRTALRRMLFERLDAVLDGTPKDLFDAREWQNMYHTGIDPLIATPRHIVRLVNALSFTYPAVRGEVNPVDFIAIEALRLLYSQIYALIRDNPDKFAGASDTNMTYGAPSDDARRFHQDWLETVAERERNAVREMMTRLFPRVRSAFGGSHYGSDWLRQWRRELHICSPDIFPIYFRLAPAIGTMTHAELRALIALVAEPRSFAEALLKLAQQRRPDGISRLRVFLERLEDYTEKDIAVENIPSILIILFGVGDALLLLDNGRVGFFDIGNDIRIIRVIHQLLERLEQPTRFDVLTETLSRGDAVTMICHEVAILGQQHGKYGAQENRPAEQRLVTAEQLAELELIGLQKIREAVEQDRLLQAPQLFETLSCWRSWAGDEEPRVWAQRIITDDTGMLTFLVHFLGNVRGITEGDVAVRVEHKLDPQALAPYVDTDAVMERIATLNPETLDARQQLAIAAYKRGYLLRQQGNHPMHADEVDEDE